MLEALISVAGAVSPATVELFGNKGHTKGPGGSKMWLLSKHHDHMEEH